MLVAVAALAGLAVGVAVGWCLHAALLPGRSRPVVLDDFSRLPR